MAHDQIGQRYHVIVEATHPLPVDNYWIRMSIADGCNGFNKSRPLEEKMGILRYNATDNNDPDTKANTFGTTCADEPYDKLKPMLPWKIGPPSNERKQSVREAQLNVRAFS